MMARHRSLLCLTVALAFITPPLAAQVDATRLSLHVAETGMPLAEFLRLGTILMGREIDAGDLDVSAITVPTFTRATIHQSEVPTLFDAVLHGLGLYCVPNSARQDAGLRLAKLAADACLPAASPARFVWPTDLVPDPRQLVFTTVTLRHLDAADAARRLRALVDGANVWVGATALGALLVHGAGTEVCRARDLTRQLDVPTDLVPERVATGFGFVEGPAWHPTANYLLFSDIRNDRILRLGADGEVTTHLEPSARANGLMFDPAGRLYACLGGARELVRFDDGERTVLAAQFGGEPLNSPNDLALDATGGVWFTDPRYGRADDLEQTVMAVYYAAADGTLTRAIDDLERPNGIILSTDGTALFVAEPNRREIWKYTVLAPGRVGARELFFRSIEQLDGGGPDGMALDRDGRLFATYDNVLVLAPNGDVERRIPMPEKPSNCTFGGRDGKSLFITARTSLYHQRLEVPGAPLLGPPALARDPQLADLLWMAGSWKSTSRTATSEEHWVAPAGGIMLGMHRDSGGNRAFFEFLRIEQRDDGIFYHAQPGGRAPTSFALTELGDRRVVFANPQHDFPQRIIYWLDAAGSLNARAEATHDGEVRGQQWVWTAASLR